MNVFKKQLRLPSSFTGMKKAVSTTNLSENYIMYFDGMQRNNTIDSRLTKSKSPLINAQEITETLQSLTSLINDKTNKNTTENFIVDELPVSLSNDWLTTKCSIHPSRQIQQKTSAIFELLTTELNFLNQMQFLLDISVKVFTQIQAKYFSFIHIEDVFLNLGDIYEVNYRFWSNYLYPSYENAMNDNEFISTKCWKDGFKEMASMFFPYQIYCAKMTQCQRYIQTLEKENKCFSQFLQWFSHLDQANRESLSDFIAKPFQRLTKYKLLLNTIGKFSDNSDEQKDIAEMVNSVNLFLRQVELKISIAQISTRIDPLEFVEPPTEELLELCVPYRYFDLTSPIHTSNGEIIREKKKEGVFKLKEAQNKVFEVSLLLFTDLILICQKIKNQETDRIKIIRPIISLRKLDLINPMPGALVIRIIDEFGCMTAMYLLTNEPSIINEWIETIQNAQILFKDIHSTNQYSDSKVYLKPRLNVISSSPVPEDFANGPSSAVSCRSVSPKSRTLDHSTSSLNMSFIRSNFRSSPVIRKRISTVAKQKHLSLSEDKSPVNLININRSLSQQQSSKSYLSILEDDIYDQPALTGDGSLSSTEFRSSNISIQSGLNDDLESTLSEKQLINLNSNNASFHSHITLMGGNHDRRNSLKDSRAYKSMVDLTTES